MDAAGWCAVFDHHPFGLVGRLGGVVPGTIVAEGGGRDVGCFEGGFDQVRFTNPGARGCWDCDGDGVAGGLEGGDEGVNVGGEAG